MKHSPGPWTMEFHGTDEHRIFRDVLFDSDGQMIAEVYKQNNTNLLKVAPDMLYALTGIQQLLSMLIENKVDKTGRLKIHYDTVSTAIKKATE